MAVAQTCDPIHTESVSLGEHEFRVFRCSWGWCVKRGDDAFRSRMLLHAFEQAWGTRLEEPIVLRLVETIERALNAEHARNRRTVSTVAAMPPAEA